MGEPVHVAEKPTAKPGVVRFETDRPLTGMGHRRYLSAEGAISAEDPADEIARRLFERGGVDAVHLYGNIVTVELARGATSEGMREIIEQLFVHYPV